MNILVRCPNCNAVFNSGFGFDPKGTSMFTSCSTVCQNCKKQTPIPDMHYEPVKQDSFTNEQWGILKTTFDEVLVRFRKGEEISSAIEKATKDNKKLGEYLKQFIPQNPEDLKTWTHIITFILALAYFFSNGDRPFAVPKKAADVINDISKRELISNDDHSDNRNRTPYKPGRSDMPLRQDDSNRIERKEEE